MNILGQLIENSDDIMIYLIFDLAVFACLALGYFVSKLFFYLSSINKQKNWMRDFNQR